MLSRSTIRPNATQAALNDAHFIDAMVEAIDGRAVVDGLADSLQQQIAFRVYRNTVRLGALDALRANYATVAQLVGDEWFAAAAHRYLDSHPPASPCLLDYGASFAGCLAQLDAAAELPYLPAVAALDRAWTEAHIAADAPPVTLDQVRGLAVAGDRIYQHPAARALWFADTPAAALWCASRSGTEDFSAIGWQAGGALLTRPEAAVVWADCDEPTVSLFASFAGGAAIASALDDAAQRYGPETAGQSLHQLVVQGALTALPAGETS